MKSILLILSLVTFSSLLIAAEVQTDCLAMNETSRTKDIKTSSAAHSKNIKGKGLSQ